MRRFASTIGLGGILAASVLSAGCPDREVTAVDPNQQKEEKKLIPVGSNRNIDILFVVDNSGSMGQEQASLNTNLPSFMNVLANIEGGLPNVHIGVVSSNTGVGGYNIQGCGGDGDDGALQNTAHPPAGQSCTPPQGRFISDELGADGVTRVKNYSGTLEGTFTCIAALGTTGCGFEQHLESMKRALDGSQPANAGFLRPDAFLAVVILADEDDCSAVDSRVFDPNDTALTGTLGPLSSFRCTEFGITCAEGNLTRTAGSYTGCQVRSDSPFMRNPDDYVTFLKGLKTDPNLIIVSGILGNPEPVRTEIATSGMNAGNPELSPSCTSANGDAAPGVRLKYFLDQFPNRNTFTSICNSDLSAGLQQIAEQLARIIGNPCLEGLIDTTDLDTNAVGDQIQCSVMDVRYPNTEQEESKTIRRCDQDSATSVTAGQALPCWWVKADPSCNDPVLNPSGLQLLVERTEGAEPPTGTYVVASCVAQ